MKWERIAYMPDSECPDGTFCEFRTIEEIEDPNLRFRTRSDLRVGFRNAPPVVELRLPFDEPDIDRLTVGTALDMLVIGQHTDGPKVTVFEGFVALDRKRPKKENSRRPLDSGTFRGEEVYRDENRSMYRMERWVFTLEPSDLD